MLVKVCGYYDLEIGINMYTNREGEGVVLVLVRIFSMEGQRCSNFDKGYYSDYEYF